MLWPVIINSPEVPKVSLFTKTIFTIKINNNLLWFDNRATCVVLDLISMTMILLCLYRLKNKSTQSNLISCCLRNLFSLF
ncbi:hypothetical protein QTP88_026246 [Uroleucon formosanum]